MDNQEENERWREISAVMMREERRKIIADASFLKIKRVGDEQPSDCFTRPM